MVERPHPRGRDTRGRTKVCPFETGTLEIAAGADGGISLLVREGSAERWLAARTALTGEALELHREVGR